jgi:hypothetical protein
MHADSEKPAHGVTAQQTVRTFLSWRSAVSIPIGFFRQRMRWLGCTDFCSTRSGTKGHIRDHRET